MTYFSGEWYSIPVAEWERIEAVIDAARARAKNEADDWWHDDDCTCVACNLSAALRALDGGDQ